MTSFTAISGYKGPKIILLKGPVNYEQWKYNVQSRLIIHGVWESIIAQKGIAPLSEKEKVTWATNNTVCWLIIHDSLDDSMRRQVNSKAGDNAYELYEKIEKLYSKSNASELISATFKVQRLRREDHTNMVEYCAHAKYWIMRMSELGESQLPSDVCASLMVLGLPDEYRSAWERIPENADSSGKHMRLEDMESALIRSEVVQESVSSSSNALKVGNFGKQDKSKSPSGGKRERSKCEHCSKMGHKKEKCWSLHPELMPEDYKKDRKEVLRVSVKKVATDDDEWVLDSGAEVHITHQRHRFDTYQNSSISISGIDNRQIKAKGRGSVSFNTPHGVVQVTDVIHVPECRFNLISVGKLADKGCMTSLSETAFYVLNKRGNKIFSGPRYKGNYLISHTKQAMVPTIKASTLRETDPKSWDGVHRRLGFAGMHIVKAASKCCDGINSEDADKRQGNTPIHRSCEACTQGKLHRMLGRTPARNSAPETSANKRGFRWHIDIAGGGNITHTLGGNRYLLGATCEATDRFIYRLIPTRNQQNILDFMRQIVAETSAIGSQVRYIRSDNAKEFEAPQVQELAKTLGIAWEWTMPYSSHQNGVEERQHRTLFERVRAVLYDSGLPERFWGEAMGYVVYTKERLPSKVLNLKSTPYEQWYGKRPDISGLKPFGTICFAYNNSAKGKKLKNRGIKCVFVGYNKGSNQYRVWNINKGDIENTSMVEFHESTVTKDDLPTNLSTTYEATPDAPSVNDPPASQVVAPDDVTGDASQLTPQESGILGEVEENDEEEAIIIGQNDVTPNAILGNMSPMNGSQISTNIEQPSVALQPEVPSDVTNHPVESDDDQSTGVGGGDERVDTLGDEELAEDTTHNGGENVENTSTGVPTSAPRRSARTMPQRNYKDMNHGRAAFAVRAASLSPTPVTIPLNAEEALNGPQSKEWGEALNKEFTSLTKNNVWTLETPPAGRKVLKGRWVLQIKYALDGTIERYKARWVAKGFEQIEGIDYNDVFSSVVKSSSWRTLLALGAKEDMEIELSDVDTAFLEAKLNDDVWVEQPHKFGDGSSKACHLQKSLYGLKQSAREWYSTLYSHLKSMGFHRLGKDNSVFRNDLTGAIIASYVDDLLLMTSSKVEMINIKKQLDKRFKLKHLGELRHYLGMRITRDRTTRSMHISQESYIKQLLVQLEMYGCTTFKSPIDKKIKLDIIDPEYKATKELIQAYSSIIGALNWLACMTRPDIAYAVHYLSRFIKQPTNDHLLAAKRVIRYLAGTMSLGVAYGPKGLENGELVGYSDASWHDCKNTGRSTSGYVFKYWNGAISWRSRLQKEVSMSTAEAEYLAAGDACKEALYIKDLMHELHQKGDDVEYVKIMVDNTAAIQIANNPVSHSRTKHISLCYHLVRDLVGKKRVHLQWASTDTMVADPLTKALPAKHYEHIIGLLSMTDGLNQKGRVEDENNVKNVKKVISTSFKISGLGTSGASKFATGKASSTFSMAQGAKPPEGDVEEDSEASK